MRKTIHGSARSARGRAGGCHRLAADWRLRPQRCATAGDRPGTAERTFYRASCELARALGAGSSQLACLLWLGTDGSACRAALNHRIQRHHQLDRMDLQPCYFHAAWHNWAHCTQALLPQRLSDASTHSAHTTAALVPWRTPRLPTPELQALMHKHGVRRVAVRKLHGE